MDLLAHGYQTPEKCFERCVEIVKETIHHYRNKDISELAALSKCIDNEVLRSEDGVDFGFLYSAYLHTEKTQKDNGWQGSFGPHDAELHDGLLKVLGNNVPGIEKFFRS